MNKRGLFLIILTLIVLLILFLIIRLTYKNSTLKYLSDDARQIELLKTLSTSIVKEKFENKDIILSCNSEFYLNFVNNTAYVTSQREEINNLIISLSSSKPDATEYTLFSSFDLKTLSLTLKLEEQSENDSKKSYEIIYKLKKNKKDNTINFKEKSFLVHET